MIERESAERVAREWCQLFARPELQQAVVDVLTSERTRIVLNQMLNDIGEKARFLTDERNNELKRLIVQILNETALKAKENAENGN